VKGYQNETTVPKELLIGTERQNPETGWVAQFALI
jgi:hypothetical protein